MISGSLKLITLLALAGLGTADCDLHNTLTEPMTEPETREALCKPQGADTWTFAMDVSEVAVPTFDGENQWAGLSSNTAFIVYDNYCIPKGVYDPGDEGNNCGSPFWINDLGLPYDIKITELFMSPANGHFTIQYSDGAYSIGANQAGCQDLSSGLRAEAGCKTGFPVDG